PTRPRRRGGCQHPGRDSAPDRVMVRQISLVLHLTFSLRPAYGPAYSFESPSRPRRLAAGAAKL
ncbi:MAG: hypothetical protein ACLPLZ_04915, partial [Terracidiphilus sp.]